MAEFIKTQNSFSSGEVAPEFYAKDGINGLSRLENMDVLSSGALSRRCGLRHVDNLVGAGRLLSFSVSDGEEYIIVLGDYHMDIYRDNELFQDLITPWSYNDVAHVQYAQRFGTMIFVHPDFPPQTLSKSNTEDRFYISEFSFSRNDADMTVNMPFVRFQDASNITISVTTHSSGNNYATFTASSNFWTPDNVNARLYLLDKQWIITEYISPTKVVAYTNGAYTLPSSPVSDWREAAFGARRGWPRSITFHQDRLVFGGSRSWPGGVWMSQVGRHNNFNTGTGLDDEAIFISLLSQQREQICTVVSRDNLQILTNVGEWAISSKPLTPSSVDIKKHTSVGSYTARYLPPQQIEGATVFVSGNGQDIRELSLDELAQNYNANDLCALSKHLMKTPIDVAYNAGDRRLFIVRDDGLMSVLNQNSALGISAWATYRTDGEFLSVAVSDNKTYVIVRRNGAISLEFFDSELFQDCEQYSYSFIASSLPHRASGHNARCTRIRRIDARVLNTRSVFLNGQRISLPNDIYSDATLGYTGDVSINILGTNCGLSEPIWYVHGDDCEPVTILSVSIHGWYRV